uniref:Solute carrier organic anion transporter family member n=1 Tax=Plectus sambesii TaxID=2011161 RepID=A0A914VA58_9BILA
MPHNTSEAYTSTYNSEDGDISQCHHSSPISSFQTGDLNASTTADFVCHSAEKQSGSFRYVFLFCLAHFLHGVGATPLFTLGVSYIDENVKPSLSSLYLGVFYAFAIFGPAIGRTTDSVSMLSTCLHSAGLDIRHIPIAVYRLLTNGSYMLITLGMAVDGLIIAGASTFMSKYLERQFNVAPSRANVLIGCIMVPMAGIGTMFSGFLVQHFRLTCRKTLQLCVAMIVLTLIMSPMYLIYCDHDKLVGIETGYPDFEKMSARVDLNITEEPTLIAKCNSHCNCLASEFHPVCAEVDGQQIPFYSPCFAGCSDKYEPMRKEYRNCSCLPASMGAKRIVKNGYCESKCSGLVAFLVLFAPFIFCTFAVGVPLISVVLRTVDYAERSFALGIQWILVRVIGTIPAPVLFGWMFDVSCIKRHFDPCTGHDGSCYLYYNKLLADLFLAFSVVGQTVTLLFLVLALVLYSGSLKDDPITVERQEIDE